MACFIIPFVKPIYVNFATTKVKVFAKDLLVRTEFVYSRVSTTPGNPVRSKTQKTAKVAERRRKMQKDVERRNIY